MVQLSHPYLTTGKAIALTIQTFVGKVMFLLLNTLSRFVIAFLPRSKCLFISWLRSPSAVILEPKKIKSVTVSIVSPPICHEGMGPDAMILVFWMLSFKTWFLEFARNSVIFTLGLNISASSIGMQKTLLSLQAAGKVSWEVTWALRKSGWYPEVIVTTGISVLRRKVGLSVKIYQVISKRHALVSLRETAVMGLGDSLQYCILEFWEIDPTEHACLFKPNSKDKGLFCYIASNNNLLESMDGRIGLILMVVSTPPCTEL